MLVPFLDRYKKFSWKDRPWVTAFGIVGLAQILVTTYWGFYIPIDSTLPLVERLVIDPINLYVVMILLIPLGIGFSYMMIHLAKEAERKSKLAKDKGPKKVAQIEFSEKWINWIIIALIAFQVFLNLAAYNAALSGMNNMSLFFAGLILIVFAGLFHVYRYAMAQAKTTPPPPGAKIRATKSMIGTQKELSEDSKPSPTLDTTDADGHEKVKKIETTENPNPSTAPDAPEIKANSADLDMKKDTDIGMSDLKKP
jgi:ubiquinol-cytochrome c reductase cytochrome b subunit